MLESLFNNVAGFQAWNFVKKRLQHRYFPVNVTKFLRTAILKNTCEWLLLFMLNVVVILIWLPFLLIIAMICWFKLANAWKLAFLEKQVWSRKWNWFWSWAKVALLCNGCIIKRKVLMLKATNYRSSHQSCTVKEGVLKNFANFTGKHVCWSLFLTKYKRVSLLKRDSSICIFQ